jgi:hypothetical protein
MSTTKPQFNCRLDPAIDKEIDDYTRVTGVAKGKLVESLWNFYNMKDLRVLREKLSAEALICHDPRKLSELYLLMITLQNILKGIKDDNSST